MAGGTCIDAGYVPTSNSHGQGAVAVSADGGQTWALASVPSGLGVLQSTTCLSASVCLAAGTTGTTVSDVVPAKGELLRSERRRPHLDTSDRQRCRSMTCTAWPALRPSNAPWSGRSGIGFPAVDVGAVAQSTRCRPHVPSIADLVHPHDLDRGGLPVGDPGCIAVGGDTVARITLLHPERHAAPTSPQETAAT